MRRIVACAFVAACLTVAAAACSNKPETAPPVASPSVTLSHADPSIGSPLDITYTFTVPAGAPAISDNYMVFAHFLDRDGELMWTDDHMPTPPTRDWKPGATIRYARMLFVPKFQYVGEAYVEVGLYLPKTGQRLPLAGQDMGMRSYRVATFTLRPQPDATFVVFKSGWHDTETGPPGSNIAWQWSNKTATLSFRNPHADAVLFFQCDQPVSALGAPQHVDLKIGDATVDSFDLPAGHAELRRVALTADQLGKDDAVDLTVNVDRAFVPAKMPALKSSDPRELGIRVFRAYLQPK